MGDEIWWESRRGKEKERAREIEEYHLGYRRCRLRGPALGRRRVVDRLGSRNSRNDGDIRCNLVLLGFVIIVENFRRETYGGLFADMRLLRPYNAIISSSALFTPKLQSTTPNRRKSSMTETHLLSMFIN